LHDIGRVGIPDSILLKRGKLTRDEWAVMRGHPESEAEIWSHPKSLDPVVPIAMITSDGRAAVIPIAYAER
jgi:putative two-component system response regulator